MYRTSGRKKEKTAVMGVVSVLVGVAGFAVAALAYAVIATWKIAGIERGANDRTARVEARWSEKIATVEAHWQDRQDAIRTEAQLRVEALAEKESKSRHDLANQFTGVIGELRANLRDTDARHAALDRDAIRKVDLAAFEARMTADRAASEGRILSAIEKIDGRVNTLAEQVVALRQRA
jgi:hypothetical protein